MIISLASFLSQGNGLASGSLKERITELMHAGKLEILLYNSNEISFVNINNTEDASPLFGNWGTHVNYSQAILFPGARYLAYMLHGSYIGQDTIKMFNTVTGDTTDLITLKGIGGIALSPSGKELAYTIDDKGVDWSTYKGVTLQENIPLAFEQQQKFASQNQSLFVIDIESKMTEVLVESNVYTVENTAWSPDGKKIIYESGDGEKFVYDREAKTSTKILGKDTNYLSWFPDSSRIVYCDWPNAKDDDFYSIKPDGSDKNLFLENKPLGHFFPNDREIQSCIYFSPDGKYILFGRDTGFKGGSERVFVMDMETKEHISVGYGDIAGWTFSAQLTYPDELV